MNNKITKVVSAVLAVLLILVNSMTLISYAADTFMSENALENQDKTTNVSNVEFDVSYEDGRHTATLDIAQTGKVNIQVSVKNGGYLKDAVIDFGTSNFIIKDDGTSVEGVKSIDEGNRRVELNQVNSGSTVSKNLIIQMNDKNTSGSDIANRDNEITLTATYINSNGKESAVSGKVVIHTNWKLDTAETTLTHEITKYVFYKNNLIIQSRINESVKDNVLPVKKVDIAVNVPIINSAKPSYVSVITNYSIATNGNNSEATWNYDKDTGIVNLSISNDEKNGVIAWDKSENASDNFLVTYVYELTDETVKSLKESKVRVDYSAKASFETYSSNNLKLSKNIEGYEEESKEIGKIADVVLGSTGTINKGYLYNNLNASDENKQETDYTMVYQMTVPVKTLADSLILEEKNPIFIGESDYSNDVVSYDKVVRISSTEFMKLFGEGGTLELQDKNGKTLVTLNKDSQVTNGYFIVDLSAANTETIKIVTSKPQAEGKLMMFVDKAIRKDLTYTKAQLEKITSIQDEISLKINSDGEEIAVDASQTSTNFEEPTQKVNIETNKDTLSTVLPNKDVEIRVTLENDSIDDKMFDSPRVQVKLPSNINDISIKAQLYYDDELSIGSANLVDNSDGTKTIDIQLNGKQTKYNNVAAKGATIVISSDITLKELTPTTQNEIVATVTNGDGTVTESSSPLKYVAPTGLVATNGVTYKNGTEITIMSLSSDEQTGLIPNEGEGQEVTFNMNVINNYENTISNVVVLGRMPAQGNGTNANFDLTLTSGITVSDAESAKVYYSSNVNATTDLSLASNSWTEDSSSLENVKSYMIVLENAEIAQGKGFKFSYKASVPADLGYDKYTYENYSVYYTNNKADGAISEVSKAATTGLTTGTGPKFSLSIKSDTPESIKSGEVLKYTLTIKNEGSEQADDVVVTLPLVTGMTYVEEATTGGQEYQYPTDVTYTTDENDETKRYANIPVGSIPANSSIEKKIWIKTTASDTENKTVTFQIAVGNNKADAVTESVQATLTKSYFTATIYGSNNDLKEGEEKDITINVTSSKEYGMSSYFETNEETGEVTEIPVEYTGERKNTILTLNIPEEVEIVKVTKGNDEDITSSLTIKNNTATINIGTVSYYATSVTFTVKQKNLPDGVYSKEVNFSAKVKADETAEEDAGNLTFTVNKLGVSITQTSNIPSSVEVGTAETFVYTFTVKNLSKLAISDLTFTDKIPDALIYSYTNVILADGTEETYTSKDENGNATAKVLVLGAEETARIEVNVLADIVNETTTISNKGTISQAEINDVESNVVTNKINAYKKGEINNGGNNTPSEDETKTARIAGCVWLDSNNDGIKDASETKLAGVKVLLLNNKTGNIAKDSNKEDAITQTDNYGAYAFSNIYVGSYTVIFLYDSKTYSPTAYQKESVDSTMNSDAMDKTVVYEGISQTAAVTETIGLTEANSYDIDLGLVENKKFDLKLDKSITNITVTDSRGTNVHEYNKNFAKIDFKDKYIDSSTMVVEYKIVVTNEGAVPGYVKKIADYLPTELEFSSELNTDWYASTDGKTVYNNANANKLLNPGESIEVKLVLTKKMNANAMGITITNNAEIYETSNDYGLEDVDSTSGNKASNEDDYSSANVLTSIQTGQAIIYTVLGLVIVTIIGGGAYVIKKKVIK